MPAEPPPARPRPAAAAAPPTPAPSRGSGTVAARPSTPESPARIAHRAARRATRRARAASLARFAFAATALLFTGALVAATSLPAAALRTAELSEEVAMLEPGNQSLGEVSAPTTILQRDEIVVEDAVASARLDDDERAALQRVADSERPRSSFGGSPAFPRTWAQLETGYVQSPFPDLERLPISSGFGNRPGGFHGGTDIPLSAGTPIRPIASGVVSAVWQGDNPGGGGYAVFVDSNIDGQFVQSWYPHMTAGSIQVRVGQVVDITTVLGAVGSTGRSTGNHLHLELKNDDYVSFDAMLWLQTRQMRLETAG